MVMSADGDNMYLVGLVANSQLERSEAGDRITLKSLRAVANALDCDLVYALLPRADSFGTGSATP